MLLMDEDAEHVWIAANAKNTKTHYHLTPRCPRLSHANAMKKPKSVLFQDMKRCGMCEDHADD